MRDLNVKIGGPRDQAKQNIVFNVRYAGTGGDEIHKEAVEQAMIKFREELRQVQLPAEDSRRVNRSLATIEDEVKAGKPSLKDIEGALGSIGRILESVVSMAPKVVTVFRALAGTLGFSL